MGHAYMIALVLFCQTLVYREVTALFSLKGQDTRTEPSLPGGRTSQGRDPWSKTLNWYFFGVTNYFLYGESIIYYFKVSTLTSVCGKSGLQMHAACRVRGRAPDCSRESAQVHQLHAVHDWLCRFRRLPQARIPRPAIRSLLLGAYDTPPHRPLEVNCLELSCLYACVDTPRSHFIVNNILEGLIWFWVPASLVICNDIFAYICGVTMGRTPLIALSPKKTVEGFVGALFCTVAFGLWFGTYFARFDYMVCPVQDLGVGAFGGMRCARNPVFVWRDGQLPEGLAAFLSTLVSSL
jgi:phosphatidate cytidylyltransferase